MKHSKRMMSLVLAGCMTVSAVPMAMAAELQSAQTAAVQGSVEIEDIKNGGIEWVDFGALTDHIPITQAGKTVTRCNVYDLRDGESQKYLSYYATCQYNAKGQMIKKTAYDDSNCMEGWCTFAYDENGNLSKVETYYSEDSPYSITQYVRDEKGSIIKELCTVDDETYTTEYKNTYDEKGSLIKTVIGDNWEVITYENGNPVKGEIMMDGKTYVAFTCTYDSDGNETSYTEYWDLEIPFRAEYEYRTGTMPVSERFTDVPENAWYTPYVQFAFDKGIMVGTTETTFEPNAMLTRAQVAQILYHCNGKPDVSGDAAFEDVKPGEWYYNAVQWAAQQEVVSGIGDNKFAPNSNITREQLAVMLYSYEGKPSVNGEFTGFEDSAKVSSWAKNAMLWATQSGIINGSKSGNKLYLNPQGNATRAEAATMMMSYLEK